MFWDRFLRRLYRTFGDVLPTSLAAGEDIATLAHQRGFVNPATPLDDRSILILILMCRPTTVLHQAAQAVYAGGPLPITPGNVVALLRDLNPPSLQELLLLHRHGTPGQKALVAAILRRHFVPSLSHFLSRLYLDHPANQAPRADALLPRVLVEFDALPLNATEFPRYLYRRLLNELTLPPAVSDFPAQPYPDWLAELARDQPEEVRFLTCCVEHLPIRERVPVYLSFFANLSNREIHAILNTGHYLTRQTIVARLRDSYLRVIRAF